MGIHILYQKAHMKSTELCTTDVNPDPQAIGACMDTTQVGVLLVSLFNPLFKLSRLHCFDVCLFSARAFWLYAHAQEVQHQYNLDATYIFELGRHSMRARAGATSLTSQTDP